MTWMDQLRFGVAHVLLNGVGTSLPWRGKLNFLTGFYAADNPALGATDIAFALAPGATTGDIAVATSGSPTTWTASPPSTVLKSGYDVSPAEASVPLDAGVGWQTLLAWGRDTIIPVDGSIVDLTIKMVVTQETGAASAPRDVVSFRANLTRRDTASDTVTNMDDGTTVTSATPGVTWALTLPAAAAAAAGNGILNVYLYRTGASVYLQVQRHATQDRSIKFEAYFGNVVP